jgi:transposase
MTGSNPIDRGKLGTKRHILTDTNGIPIPAVITPASTHDIKGVTDVMDNAVVNKPQPTSPAITAKSKTIKQHLCLYRAYNSKAVEQKIIKRGYELHVPCKRKRGEEKAKDKENTFQKRYHPRRRWFVERTNSWHNRFRKLLVRYEKKAENYLGLVQLSSRVIIYRKIILG